MPKDKLDTIVLGEVSKRVLQPDRLQTVLESYSRDALSREGHNRERLRQLRHDHKETEAGIARLLELVEAGVMEAADASLRERLVNLRFRRDELSKEITDLQKRLASAEPAITPEKVGRLAILLRAKLHDGPPELRQAYARLLLSEVSVTREEIRISGSKAVLARTAAEGLGTAVPAVLSLFGKKNGAPLRIKLRTYMLLKLRYKFLGAFGHLVVMSRSDWKRSFNQ